MKTRLFNTQSFFGILFYMLQLTTNESALIYLCISILTRRTPFYFASIVTNLKYISRSLIKYIVTDNSKYMDHTKNIQNNTVKNQFLKSQVNLKCEAVNVDVHCERAIPHNAVRGCMEVQHATK